MNRRQRRASGFGTPRSISDLRRRPPAGPPRATILIVCEDTKSAPMYFMALRDKLYVRTVEVEITGHGADPKTLVEHAKKKKKERDQLAKRSISTPTIDEVWCVFDRETQADRPGFQDAVNRATALRLRSAVSNPCFEFWVLLHFEETTKPFENCKAVGAHLKKYLPQYAKNVCCYDAIEGQTDAAIVRARKALKIGGGYCPNPCTYVHLLVERIREISRLPYPK